MIRTSVAPAAPLPPPRTAAPPAAIATSQSGDRDADGRDLSRRPRPLVEEEADEPGDAGAPNAKLDISV